MTETAIVFAVIAVVVVVIILKTALVVPQQNAYVVERLGKTLLNAGRVDELAEKANEGTLTDEERAEYAEYVEWGDVVGIFKARARIILQRQPG